MGGRRLKRRRAGTGAEPSWFSRLWAGSLAGDPGISSMSSVKPPPHSHHTLKAYSPHWRLEFTLGPAHSDAPPHDPPRCRATDVTLKAVAP